MTHLLDVKGLACPLPVLRARKFLSEIDSGDVLQVLSTDPAAREDFVAFCEAAGHVYLSHQVIGEVLQIRLRKF